MLQVLKVIELGFSLVLVLFDLTKLLISYLFLTPLSAKVYLMVHKFYFILYFNLSLFYSTSFESISFFIFSSAICSYISCIFSLSFLLNYLKRSSCVVICSPDNMCAPSCSYLFSLLIQLIFSLCTFSVILFKGMQLYWSTKSCFHYTQSNFLSMVYINLRSFPLCSYIADLSRTSVQNTLSFLFLSSNFQLVGSDCQFTFIQYYYNKLNNFCRKSQSFQQNGLKLMQFIKCWFDQTCSQLLTYSYSDFDNPYVKDYLQICDDVATKFHRKKHLLLKNEQVWKKSSKIKTSPSAVFGRSQKNSLEKEIKPGPGAYDVNKSYLDKGLITFKSKKPIRFQTQSPGPAAYDPHLFVPSKKFSFQRSQYHNQPGLGPSPGSYQMNRTVKVLSHSFLKKKRQFLQDSQKQKFPGPTKYDKNKHQKPQKQFSFSRTKKFKESDIQESQQQQIPGPGSYNISKYQENVKSYKFTHALRNFVQNENNPGPAHYSPQKSQLQHIGGAITRQIRKFQYDNHVPGPGSYKQVPIELTKSKQPRIVITKSKQSSLDKQSPIGPGYYLKQFQKSKIPGGVIGRERRLSKPQETGPGPLSYTPQFYEVLSKTKSTMQIWKVLSIGKQKRMKQSIMKTPGPGSYQTDKRQKILSKSRWIKNNEDRRLNFTELLKRSYKEDRKQNNTSFGHH